MVCERMPHDEATVVVHEHAHVQPLGPAQPKREDVRLPQLIRRRPLEAPRPMLPLRRTRRGLDHSGLVQDPAHLLLADSQRLEPRQHVTNPTRPPLLVVLLELDHPVSYRARLRRAKPGLASTLGLQRARTVFADQRGPLLHRPCRHAERRRDVFDRRALQTFLHDQQLVRRGDLPAARRRFLLLRHRVSRSADLRQRFRGARC